MASAVGSAVEGENVADGGCDVTELRRAEPPSASAKLAHRDGVQSGGVDPRWCQRTEAGFGPYLDVA
jgi:hypothetical protein